ncbi:MAG: glycosyltransferase family 9 protein [Candidatus Pacebacteria bacterium]|nr:glycosyltransferase family 9 protein [Candidatus Paceibacterota bacterium]
MKLKLKTLFLLFLCLCRYVVFGKAQKKQKTFKKIAIFQGAKLGDMVCTTPMFRAVKEKYPQSQLVVIGDGVNKRLLEHNPDVDSYRVYKEEDIFSTIKEIKKEGVDFGCITGPSFLNLAVLYLAGIPLIVAPVIKSGWSPWETMSYKILRRFVETQPHHMGQYAPREYLRLLETIHIFTDDTTKHLVFSSQAQQETRALLEQYAGRLLIGISPSAGNKIKEWPTERFAEVANYIASRYDAVVVIIGGPGDGEYAKRMKAGLDRDVEYVDTTGILSIDELKALISKLNLFISVDTGPIYIAEAFGVPTIDIVGPVDENEQPPVGERHKIVVFGRDKPELHIMNSRIYNEKKARMQVESINVKDVIYEIAKLAVFLKENETKKS